MSAQRLPFVHRVGQNTVHAALCSALMASASAWAQDGQQETQDDADIRSVQQFETITVQGSTGDGYQTREASSPKFVVPLIDTPRTVDVIPEAVIKDRGATSLQDVLRNTPGISLGSGEGGTPTGDRPFIRGYEASTDIFIDGVRDYARGYHEVFNLESVEVIKGPSGVLTGRGGTGGSINMQTKTPKAYDFADATVGVGNGGQHRLTLDGNLTLGETSAMRLNLMRMGGDIPGRDDVKYNRWGIAPSISFGLGTPTRFTLSYSHIENKDTPDMGIPFRNDAVPDRVRPLEPNKKNFYGRKDVDFRQNKFDTATATIEHDFADDLTVRNITRYGKSLNHYLFTRPSFDNCENATSGACVTEGAGLQFTRSDRARWRESKSLINQTDIFGEFDIGSVRHYFVAGVEFGRERLYSKAMDGLPGEDTDSFWNPNPNKRYSSNISYGPKTRDGYIDTKAIYLMDTIELNEQWYLSGGVRYDRFKVHADETTGRGGAIIPAAGRTDGIWSYQAGVVYKPVYYGSVYLSYGTSANPAGENLGQAGGADGPAGGATVHDLKPEKSRSWELGTKWDLFDEQMSFTAAVFETKKTDARSQDPILDDVVTLNGKNRVRGFELGVEGAITPKWDIWAGYTYLDSKVLNYVNNGENYSGKRMKFIPKHSATLWTTYQLDPKWSVGGGVTYTGMRYVDDANKYELPSNTVVDAMVKYQVNKNFDLQLNVNNLTDTRVWDASHVGLFANVGHGRSIMLNASYHFE